MITPPLRKISILIGFAVFLVVLHSLYSCSPYVCSPKRHFVSDLKYNHHDDPTYCSEPSKGRAEKRPDTRAFVIASLRTENSSWLNQFAPAWETAAYIMDDPEGDHAYKVPTNKGREAMAYLTYIIDHYQRLPEIMVFLHASRYQWHNEDPMYDGLPMLQRLRLKHIKEVGFASLRCTWELGCPAAIHPFSRLSQFEAALEPHNERANAEASFAQAFRELFPEKAHKPHGIPTEIGIPCGGQFAVTAKRVRQRPLCEYKRYRDWLLATKLPDAISGRIFEYSWHMIFGMPAVTCPDVGHCFCEKYGLCDLTCEEGFCRGMYWPPPKWRIPEKWPEVGVGTSGLPHKGWSEEAMEGAASRSDELDELNMHMTGGP